MDETTQRSELEWEGACRREDAIRTLLNREPAGLSTEAVEAVAAELGISRATLYRMIGRYRAAGTVTSLLPRSVGRPKKVRSLSPEREALITQAISQIYLKPEKPKFSRLVQEIRLRCLEAGFALVNWRTIKARLEDIYICSVALRRAV